MRSFAPDKNARIVSSYSIEYRIEFVVKPIGNGELSCLESTIPTLISWIALQGNLVRISLAMPVLYIISHDCLRRYIKFYTPTIQLVT